MEGMIPLKNLKTMMSFQIKIGSLIDVYLERIESFKGEIIISRERLEK